LSKSSYMNEEYITDHWSDDAENTALITGVNYILKNTFIFD